MVEKRASSGIFFPVTSGHRFISDESTLEVDFLIYSNKNRISYASRCSASEPGSYSSKLHQLVGFWQEKKATSLMNHLLQPTRASFPAQ